MRSMCVGVAETGHRGFSLCADGIEYIFFALSVGYTLGFYLVGVGAYDDPRRSIKKLFSSRAFE